MPQQVNAVWPAFKTHIAHAWPPVVGDNLDRDNTILQDLLTERADLWLMQSSVRGILGALITNYIVDHFTTKQSLQLLMFVGYQDIPMAAYTHTLDMLKQYAVAKRCWKIVAYLSNVRLLAVLKQYGANTDYRFIEIKTLEV